MSDRTELESCVANYIYSKIKLKILCEDPVFDMSQINSYVLSPSINEAATKELHQFLREVMKVCPMSVTDKQLDRKIDEIKLYIQQKYFSSEKINEYEANKTIGMYLGIDADLLNAEKVHLINNGSEMYLLDVQFGNVPFKIGDVKNGYVYFSDPLVDFPVMENETLQQYIERNNFTGDRNPLTIHNSLFLHNCIEEIPLLQAEKEKVFHSFQNFCKINMQIKDTMINMAPEKQYMYDENYLIKLSDTMYRELKDIRSQFRHIFNSFDLPDYAALYDKKIENMQYQLAEAGINAEKIQKFYQTYISDMSEHVVDETSRSAKGENLLRYQELLTVAENATTVNELLHIIHAGLTNDNNLFIKMPVIATHHDRTDYGGNISLTTSAIYGVNTELSHKLFQAGINAVGTDNIYVVSMNPNQAILMARGKGHALSIKVDVDRDGKCHIDYFIPKICNSQMVNELKGVRKVEPGSEFATGLTGTRLTTNGSFDCMYKDLGKEMLCFISNVPGDGQRGAYKHVDLSEIISEIEPDRLTDLLAVNRDLAEAINIDEQYVDEQTWEDVI